MTIAIPSHLSDSALIAEVTRCARDERHATAQLVAHLAELDARASAWETVRLFMMKPERRSWLGVPQRGSQPGLALPGDVSVAAY